MTTETKQVFYCDHCKKWYSFSKAATAKHEKHCPSNPANYPLCHDCGNLEKIDTEVTFSPYSGGTQTKTVQKYHCVKLDKMLHSFKAVAKGLITKYPHQFENSELMPTTCASYGNNQPTQEADTFL